MPTFKAYSTQQAGPNYGVFAAQMAAAIAQIIKSFENSNQDKLDRASRRRLLELEAKMLEGTYGPRKAAIEADSILKGLEADKKNELLKDEIARYRLEIKGLTQTIEDNHQKHLAEMAAVESGERRAEDLHGPNKVVAQATAAKESGTVDSHITKEDALASLYGSQADVATATAQDLKDREGLTNDQIRQALEFSRQTRDEDAAQAEEDLRHAKALNPLQEGIAEDEATFSDRTLDERVRATQAETRATESDSRFKEDTEAARIKMIQDEGKATTSKTQVQLETEGTQIDQADANLKGTDAQTDAVKGAEKRAQEKHRLEMRSEDLIPVRNIEQQALNDLNRIQGNFRKYVIGVAGAGNDAAMQVAVENQLLDPIVYEIAKLKKFHFEPGATQERERGYAKFSKALISKLDGIGESLLRARRSRQRILGTEEDINATRDMLGDMDIRGHDKEFDQIYTRVLVEHLRAKGVDTNGAWTPDHGPLAAQLTDEKTGLYRQDIIKPLLSKAALAKNVELGVTAPETTIDRETKMVRGLTTIGMDLDQATIMVDYLNLSQPSRRVERLFNQFSQGVDEIAADGPVEAGDLQSLEAFKGLLKEASFVGSIVDQLESHVRAGEQDASPEEITRAAINIANNDRIPSDFFATSELKSRFTGLGQPPEMYTEGKPPVDVKEHLNPDAYSRFFAPQTTLRNDFESQFSPDDYIAEVQGFHPQTEDKEVPPRLGPEPPPEPQKEPEPEPGQALNQIYGQAPGAILELLQGLVGQQGQQQQPQQQQPQQQQPQQGAITQPPVGPEALLQLLAGQQQGGPPMQPGPGPDLFELLGLQILEQQNQQRGPLAPIGQ